MLTQQTLDRLYALGELRFEFEDALLHLNLEPEEEDLLEAEKQFKRGKIAAEVVLREQLLAKAKAGNVGATKELLRQDAPKKKEVNEPVVSVNSPHLRDGLYQHQCEWVSDENRIRFYTASRRTGKTRTFGREGFFDGIGTGRPQNFLSATKRQAGLFRNYIKDISYKEFGIKLKGTDEIILQTKHGMVPINFLTPSVIYSQGFTGNLYVDEAAWMRNFEDLNTYIKPSASEKYYRTTYLTTASSMGHGAYAFKEGYDRDGKQKKKDDNGNVLRRDGRILISNHVTTLPEAIEKGYDRFEWEDILDEYTEDEINQLFLCEWINERSTFFKMSGFQKTSLHRSWTSTIRSGMDTILPGHVILRVIAALRLCLI